MNSTTRNMLAGAVGMLALMMTACTPQQPVQAKEADSKVTTRANDALEVKGAPAPVQKTVMEQSDGGTLVGFTTEKEKGETLYEAEMKVGGHSRNLLIDASGTVREVEEETELSALPKGVQAEVQKSVGKSKIMSMEAVTKSGKLAGYELRIQDAKGKESGLNLNAEGKRKAKDEDGEDDDDDEEDGK